MLTYADGNVYDGPFVYGYQAGYGCYYQANGGYYEGHIEQDQWHGIGKWVRFSCGEVITGRFHKGIKYRTNNSPLIFFVSRSFQGVYPCSYSSFVHCLFVQDLTYLLMNRGYTQCCGNWPTDRHDVSLGTFSSLIKPSQALIFIRSDVLPLASLRLVALSRCSRTHTHLARCGHA